MFEGSPTCASSETPSRASAAGLAYRSVPRASIVTIPLRMLRRMSLASSRTFTSSAANSSVPARASRNRAEMYQEESATSAKTRSWRRSAALIGARVRRMTSPK